ncbi:MAG: hypothetical protein RI996_237 [Candidatus Parcubacteria bacterium]|jgi:uncharacterized membrane protein YdbT with pleckstrin-like domain
MPFELQPNEIVLATLRKHWLLFVIEIFGLFVLFWVPIILSTLPIFPILSESVATFLGALWMLLICMKGFISWTTYYLDVWVITNIRLVDIEQESLFNRKSSTLELDNIEDITVHINGFFESIIGYGKLSVQTAGNIPEFLINNIPDPEAAKQIIYGAQHSLKKREERVERAESQLDLE